MTLLFDHAPIIGLLFFFSVFLVVFWLAYRPGAKQTLQSYALIPLKEEDHHG